MVIPGDVAEMTEFQEKTMNNSRYIVELCFSNVQLVFPSKAFYEKLHNRYKMATEEIRVITFPIKYHLNIQISKNHLIKKLTFYIHL